MPSHDPTPIDRRNLYRKKEFAELPVGKRVLGVFLPPGGPAQVFPCRVDKMRRIIGKDREGKVWQYHLCAKIQKTKKAGESPCIVCRLPIVGFGIAYKGDHLKCVSCQYHYTPKSQTKTLA